MAISSSQKNLLTNISKIISHDLRAHSSNVILLLEAMKLSNKYGEEDELLSMLSKSANSVSKTIENLYNVLSIHTKTGVEKTPIVLHTFVEDIITSSDFAENNALTLVNEIDKDTTLNAVSKYLEQIITSLIHNAIRRSGDQPCTISINAEEQSIEVVIKVKDNARGFNMNLIQNNVFNMYHGSNTEGKTIDIDLFLVKNQIEVMGGSISVESEHDKETTFKIHLPHE